MITHVCPNEPAFDLDAYTFTQRICAEVLEIQDTAIVNACIKAAKEAGITDLYLIDKRFVIAALLEKIERESAKEDDHATD